jgi:hypothetical protein
MVVVAVGPLESEALRMALALILANIILLAGPDVGVIIE